jgi:hypothetical protein
LLDARVSGEQLPQARNHLRHCTGRIVMVMSSSEQGPL